MLLPGSGTLGLRLSEHWLPPSSPAALPLPLSNLEPGTPQEFLPSWALPQPETWGAEPFPVPSLLCSGCTAAVQGLLCGCWSLSPDGRTPGLEPPPTPWAGSTQFFSSHTASVKSCHCSQDTDQESKAAGVAQHVALEQGELC